MESVDNIRSLERAFQCGVCFETYRDPRNLQCGHQFCRECLQEILNQQVNRSIPCPTCRAVTDLPAGKDIADLTRPVLINDLQERIAGLLHVQSAPTASGQLILCNKCATDSLPATYHCGKCDQFFCNACEHAHGPMEGVDGHDALPVSMLCPAHHKEQLVMHCQDCNVCACAICIMGDHRNHRHRNLDEAARASTTRLQRMIENEHTLETERKKIAIIAAKITEMKKVREQFRRSINDTYQLLSECENKLNKFDKETENAFSVQIDLLESRKADIRRILSFEESLFDKAKHLLNNTAQPECIVSENEISTAMDNVTDIDVGGCKQPYYDKKTFDSAAVNLELVSKVANVHWYDTSLYSKEPITGMVCQFFKNVGFVSGLTVDSNRQRVIVREWGEPIRMYNYDGELQESIASDVEDVVVRELSGYMREVCMDTLRDLLLVPFSTSLILLDLNGGVQSRILIGVDLRGVAYCRENDSYVVSDVAAHNIHVINAGTKQFVTIFGSLGSRDPQLNFPSKLCAGKIAGIEEPVIVVSDTHNHCIKVFDMTGKHLKTFGRKCTGEELLKAPGGVTIDPAGRIIVCDKSDGKFLSYWLEEGQVMWRILEEEQASGEKPKRVSVDPVNRVMAVSTRRYICIYKEQ